MIEIMKIDKLKLIEGPIEEIMLDSECLDSLLGGTYCQVFTGGYCQNYEQAAICGSAPTPAGIKCGYFGGVS